jgi:hypothetical protein
MRRRAQAIYYKVVGSGACGYVESDDGFTVALAQSDWEGGSLCGKVGSTPFFAGSGGIPDVAMP